MRRDLQPGCEKDGQSIWGMIQRVFGFEQGGDHELPEYALHYFDSLKAKFEMLVEPSADDPAGQKAYGDAKRVVDAGRERLTWSNLMLLNLSIVRSATFEALRFEIADLRSRLEGNSPALPADLTVKLGVAKKDDLDALRAEAQVLVTRVWHMRMARHARDRYVGELRRTLLWWMVGIVGLFILIALPFAIEKRIVPLFFIIMTAGMMGALISILRRLQAVLSAPANPDQSSDLSALAHERRSALISLIAGGVFAILLYVIFVAGAYQLSDQLTPKFNSVSDPKKGVDFLAFVLAIGPIGTADYARVIVWSFIAGFFEQIVPDVLDRIVTKK